MQIVEVGTIVPGAGNVVGAVAGTIISVGIYYFTDMKENSSGNTLGEEAKAWVRGLW